MKLTINIPEDLHQALKIAAAEEGVTITEILHSQTRQWLEKRKPAKKK